MNNETTYLSCAETARLIRKALADSFPGIAFSVRSKVYSGGASVTVRWTDGPNTAQVDAIAGQFSGATFDGMIDLKSYHASELNGRRVHFGADFVFTNREHSDAALARALSRVARHWGTPELPVADYRSGRAWSTNVANAGNRSVMELANELLWKHSDRLGMATQA